MELFNNYVVMVLSVACLAGDTTITVNDASLLHTSGNYRLKVDDEIVLVTSRTGNVITVVRGQEGTVATAHAIGDTVVPILTEGAMNASVYAPTFVGSDVNSLVGGDVSAIEWSWQNPANRVASTQNVDTDGTYLDLVHVNRDGAAVGDGSRATMFSVPATATGATFSVPAKLPSGVLSSTIYISIEDRFGNVQAHATAVLTATLTTFSCTASALLSGCEYVARIVTNNAGLGTSAQAQALIGRVTVTPNSTTGMFAAPFARLSVQPSRMHDCGRADFMGGKYWRFNAFSRFVFDTTATTIAVEWETTVAALDSNAAYLLVIVNGRPYKTLTAATPTGALTTDYLANAEFTLPSGRKRVEIVCGSQQQTQPLDTVYAPLGTFPRAVYAQNDKFQTELVPHVPQTRRLLMVHDSILSGITNPQSVLYAVPVLMRQRNGFPGSIASDGFGGRTLDEITKTTGAINAFVRNVQSYDPTDLWMELGPNDVSTLSSATFQTRVQSLVTALRTAMPNLMIWWQTLTLRSSDTFDAWRVAVTNVEEATNDPHFVAVEGKLAFTVAQTTAGGLHANPDGCSSFADYAASVFRAFMPHHSPGCAVFWEADHSTVAAGKVTAVKDQSIAANDGVVNVAVEPTYVASSWNGLPALQFPGRVDSNLNSGFSGDQIFTVITGVAMPDLTSSGIIFGFGNTAGVGADAFGVAFSVPAAGDINLAWTASNNQVFGAYTTAPQIITARKTAAGALNANTDNRENGTAQTLGAGTAATPNTTNDPFHWGAWDSGGLLPMPTNATSPFVAAFNRKLPNSTVQLLEHSLGEKYGLIGL